MTATKTRRARSTKTALVREPITREFASRSGSSTHTVTVTPTKGIGNKYDCTCLGFRRWSKCWHVTEMKNTTLAVRPNTGVKKESTMSKSTKSTKPAATNTNIKESTNMKTTTVTITADGFETLTLDLTAADVKDLGLVKIKKSRKVASASEPVLATKTKKVEKVAPAKKVTTKKTAPSHDFPMGVPVNVKVKGEKTMRRSVVLGEHANSDLVTCRIAGKRGRPAHLAVEQIERVRAL